MVGARVEGGAGCLLLNRPKALNALSHEMIVAAAAQLARWRDDPAVTHVVIEGGDRAFSAGADVRAVYDNVINGDAAAVRRYFADEYALDLALARYPKPTICLVDGICFGGGMGLAVASRFCVATERASFAMPETLIGFFPDAGATSFLPRLPGHLGLFLGLTGTRISGPDAVHLGLATHFASHERLAGARTAIIAGGAAALDGLAEAPPPLSLANEMEQVDRFFAAETLNGIFESLAADGGAWAAKTLSLLRARSPSALARTFAMLRRPAGDLAACLQHELAETAASTAHPDFREGVRAALVDKDKSPRWQAESGVGA